MFLHGSNFRNGIPTDLDGLIELALHVDARLTQVLEPPEYAAASSCKTVCPTSDHKPMQLGSAWLSREDRDRRRARGLCIYCGTAGHFLPTVQLKVMPHSGPEGTVWWIISGEILIHNPPPSKIALAS